MHSRQQSAVDDMKQNHTFSRGNYSASGSAAKADENWTTISDKAERRRMQNRIAQRAYRQKLKERLRILEWRTAELQFSASAGKLHPHSCYDDECYATMSTQSNTNSDEHCCRCSHAASRAGTASPPTQYANQFPSYGHPNLNQAMSQSPKAQLLSPDMLSYYTAQSSMRQIPGCGMPLQQELVLSTPYTEDSSQDVGIDMSHLQPFDYISKMKFEPEEIPTGYELLVGHTK